MPMPTEFKAIGAGSDKCNLLARAGVNRNNYLISALGAVIALITNAN